MPEGSLGELVDMAKATGFSPTRLIFTRDDKIAFLRQVLKLSMAHEVGELFTWANQDYLYAWENSPDRHNGSLRRYRVTSGRRVADFRHELCDYFMPYFWPDDPLLTNFALTESGRGIITQMLVNGESSSCGPYCRINKVLKDAQKGEGDIFKACEDSIRNPSGEKTPLQIVRQLGWVLDRILRNDIDKARSITSGFKLEHLTDEGSEATKELRAAISHSLGACNALIKTLHIAENMAKDKVSKMILQAVLRTVIHKFNNRVNIIQSYFDLTLNDKRGFAAEGLKAIKDSLDCIGKLIENLPKIDSVRGAGNPDAIGGLIEIFVPGISDISDFPYLVPESPIAIGKFDQKKTAELIKSTKSAGAQQVIVVEGSRAGMRVFLMPDDEAVKLSLSGQLIGRNDGIFIYSRKENIKFLVNRNSANKISGKPLNDQETLFLIQVKAEYVETNFPSLVLDDPKALLEKTSQMQLKLKEKAKASSWEKRPAVYPMYKELSERLAYFKSEALENIRLFAVRKDYIDVDTDNDGNGQDLGQEEN